MTTDSIIVQRLIKHYNPYTPLGLRRERFFEKKWRPRTKFIDDKDRSPDEAWHYGRIAHFVNEIRKGNKLDEIIVDMNWFGISCTGIAVIDGHHRLCAADIAGAERIPASVGGIVDIIQWLAGIHDNAPE